MGEKLDDTNIIAQCITFLIAGHETTSGLLSFALYVLLKNPDVLARAYDEVDRVLGTDLGVLPSYPQLHQVPYVTQVLEETLRLWPTAPAFTRHSYEGTVIGGKYYRYPGRPVRELGIAAGRHQARSSSGSAGSPSPGGPPPCSPTSWWR